MITEHTHMVQTATQKATKNNQQKKHQSAFLSAFYFEGNNLLSLKTSYKWLITKGVLFPGFRFYRLALNTVKEFRSAMS